LLISLLLFPRYTYAIKGDVNNDDIIDGKDALKIIMVIENRIPEPSQDDPFWENADVFPLPGEGGRLIGDGQITKEDANKIMLMLVGLISEGEISGDFGNSLPQIDGFSPSHGPVGTKVTIFGKNFIADSSGENIVLFGDITAPIHSAIGKEIVTEVPPGAESNKIRIVTPGGVAISPFEFSITAAQTGQLVPPTGTSPTDYNLVNKFGDETNPLSEGSYTIPKDNYGVNTTVALPKDDSDRILLCINLPDDGSQVSNESTMNLLSTAQAMVFLSPYFVTINPDRAKKHIPYILNDPKVAELAQLLGQLYQETPEPFDDPRFEPAYKKAIKSVIDRLPDELVVDLQQLESEAQSMREKRLQSNRLAVEKAEQRVRIIRLLANEDDEYSGYEWQTEELGEFFPDKILTLVGDSSKPGNITPKSITGNPVDWFVHLAEVGDLYNTFPYGMQSIVAMNPYQALPREGYEEVTFISSNSYTKYIDVFGRLFELLWDGILGSISDVAAYFGWESLKGAASPDGDLHVAPDKDGVYVVRAFSGMLQGGTHPGEFDYVWDMQDGKQDFWVAFGFNAAMAGIDAASVWIDVKTAAADKGGGLKLRRIVRMGVRKGIRLATKKLPKGVSGVSSGQLVKTILSIVNSVACDISCVVSGDVSAALLESSSKKILKFLGKSIDPLYKISVGSAAVERTIALAGFQRNVTPLETWVLVVGKPFTPQVERVEPQEGPQGEEVTLIGEHFDSRNKDYNKVRLGYYWQDAKEAEIVSVNATGTILKFKIPEDIPHGEYKILVKTPYTPGSVDTSKTFNVKRIPRLLGVNPSSGFKPVPDDADSPFASFKGTTVKLTGRAFCVSSVTAPDDELYFGQTFQEYKGTNSDCTEIETRVPDISPGATEIFIKSPEWNTETQHLPFTVLDTPVLSSVTPTQAMVGQYMVVVGNNFGGNTSEVKIQVGSDYNAKILSVENTKIAFQMPSVGEPGDELDVSVWTPAGQSATQKVTRLEGVTVPDIEQLPYGYSITVNATSTTNNGADGKVSLDDAAAFARGENDPFAVPWDDRNEKYTTHYIQQKVYDEENARWTYPWKKGETVGPEYSDATKEHEFRRNYRVNHYHADNGGEVSDPYLVSSVDLDETEEQMEEGDYVQYYSGKQGGKDYKDRIYVYGTDTYHAVNVELGEQDELEMSEDSTLQMTGRGISLNKNGCTLKLGKVTCNLIDAITITGNRNYISRANFTNCSHNFVTINGGLANSLSGDVTGDKAGGNGVEINNGHKNSITGTLLNCAGHGIYVKNGEENSAGGTIKHCTGNGVFVDGGRNNNVGGMIEDCEYGVEVNNSFGTKVSGNIYKGCRKSGVYVHDGEKYVLEGFNSEENQRHGIELANVKLSYIGYDYTYGWWSVTSKSNTGDGIHIRDGCMRNTFSSVETLGNENGIVLYGADTSFNGFEHYNDIGIYNTGSCGVYCGEDYELLGNRKNGIYIYGGAHDNTIADCRIFGSVQHGILIEGATTQNNKIDDCCIGLNWTYSYSDYPDFTYDGNKGDGVHICGGAKRNVICDNDIGNNDGNGITIDGENTDFNKIDDCHIGGDTGEVDGNPPPRPNKGFGILISNNAMNTLVQNSTLGINLSGGVKVSNVNKTYQEDEERQITATIDSNHIGYHWHLYDGWTRLAGTAGNGIHLDKSTDVFITDNYIYAHEVGIYIGGEGSEHNQIDGGLVRKSSKQGLLIENSKSDEISLAVYEAGSHGIQLSQTDSICFLPTLSRENQGAGFYLNKANWTVLQSLKLPNGGKQILESSRNNSYGLHINDSHDLIISLCEFTFNNDHGILVDGGSDKVEISAPYVSDNSGIGIYLLGSNNIQIHPEKNDSLYVNSNTNSGIVVENAKNVKIGKLNQASNNISGNGQQGILIKGEQTDDVDIVAVNYIGNNDAEGVRVDNGKNICIGGQAKDEGNSIENNTIGVLAQGTNTQLSILNNNIGEPEMWESGARAYGNEVGIKLQGKINNVQIEGNHINANKTDGILLTDGTHDNVISRNTITDNGNAGVCVSGISTKYNVISMNSITNNLGMGIELDGGNEEIVPPVINHVTWRAYTIAGTVDAPKNSTVEVYADSADEGETLLGISRVYGNNFYANANVPTGAKLHAIVIHPNGNSSEFGPCEVAFSNPKAVFTSTRDGNQELYLLYSGRTTRLTNEIANDYSPKISPNPDHIMYVSEKQGNPDIWIMDIENPNPNPLICSPAPDYDPVWYPDCTKAAFVSEKDGNPEIYTVEIDLNAPGGQVIYDDGFAEYYVAGKQDEMIGVHFSFQPGIMNQIKFYIFGQPAPFKWQILGWQDGKPLKDLVLDEGMATPEEIGWYIVETGGIEVPSDFVIAVYYLSDDMPQLGFDASQPIDKHSWYYSSYQQQWGNEQWIDYMIRVVFEITPQRITENDATERYPCWSHDKTKIAFASDRAGSMDIWVMDADGNNPVPLTSTANIDEIQPVWSPDDSKIAFISNAAGNMDIWMMDADGNNQQNLTNSSVPERDPCWTKDGELFFTSEREGGWEVYQMRANGGNISRLTTSLGKNTQPDSN